MSWVNNIKPFDFKAATKPDLAQKVDQRPLSASSLCNYASFDLPTELEIVRLKPIKFLGHVSQLSRVHANCRLKTLVIRENTTFVANG